MRIEKRGKNSWRIQKNYNKHTFYKTIHSETTPSQVEVEAIISQMIEDAISQGIVERKYSDDIPPVTVEKAINAYIKINKDYISEDYSLIYARVLLALPKWFAEKQIDGLTIDDIEGFQDALINAGKSKKFIKECLCLIKRVYRTSRNDIFEQPRILNAENYIVYFVKNNQGALKIGVTNDIEKRMRAFRTANCIEPELIHKIDCNSRLEAYQTEKSLHNTFAEYRISGEWFDEKAITNYLKREKAVG